MVISLVLQENLKKQKSEILKHASIIFRIYERK